jgi:hypothetical protein
MACRTPLDTPATNLAEMARFGTAGKVARLMRHPERWAPVYDELIVSLPDPLVNRLSRKGRVRGITSLPDLDRELEKAEQLFLENEDQARQFLATFEFKLPAMPPDPYSEAYREVQWDLYRHISGRDTYTIDNEHSPFEWDKAVACPFPYSTGSAAVVGDQLIAHGYIIKSLNLPRNARILEFGAGWGNVTLALATMGLDVTVVEAEPDFAKLIELRTAHLNNVHIVTGDMLEFQPDGRYDGVLFFESFHHCSDHLQMLERLHHVVTPTAPVAFAAEPISDFPYPWGLRLDGMSLWSTRTYGWLELGFNSRYFADALKRTGWTSRRRKARRASPLADIILAREARNP